MNKKTYLKHLIWLTILLIIMFLTSLSIGRYSNDPADVISVLTRGLMEGLYGDDAMEKVVFFIRLPRIVAAMMIGAMLSLSGAVYQGVFRNPLVSPDILGVSSGAAVGAAAAILLGMGMAEKQLMAFMGGLIAVFLTTLIPRAYKNSSNMMLVLSGIIVSGFLSAVIAVMKFVAEEQTELSSIVFWQMGSVSFVNYRDLIGISPVFIICSLLLVLLSWKINILSFSEEEAKSLGVNTTQIRRIVIVCASLLTASAVSISGTVGWIGLVIPHLSRLLVGTSHTKMLPVTLLMGALFMLFIDTLARGLTTMEIPLSILTGFISAPVFGILLFKKKANIS